MFSFNQFFVLTLIVYLTNSVEIELECNIIEQLRSGLKVLHFGFNKVEILADNEAVSATINATFNEPEFANMSMRIFSGRNNNLVYCPAGFAKTFHNDLLVLDYIDSKIKFVSRKCFADMKHLRKLYLDNNEIENIPEDTFWDLPELFHLNISDNKIKVLEEKLLLESTHLSSFYADDNKIETLTANHFEKNSKLSELSMSNGSLTTITVNFQGFEFIRMIDFTENPCTNQSFHLNATADSQNTADLEAFQKNLNETCSRKSATP
jgi:Leucine-rich repeat (LRR) protein